MVIPGFHSNRVYFLPASRPYTERLCRLKMARFKLPALRFFRYYRLKHLEGARYQVCVNKKRPLPFFRRLPKSNTKGKKNFWHFTRVVPRSPTTSKDHPKNSEICLRSRTRWRKRPISWSFSGKTNLRISTRTLNNIIMPLNNLPTL